MPHRHLSMVWMTFASAIEIIAMLGVFD